MPLLIRPETPADGPAVEALTAAAFLNAPHTSHTEQFIVNALRRAGQLSVSLVAVHGSAQLVGHVAASPVVLSTGAAGWFGLGPLSVVPDRQGEGIGTHLMHAVIAELRQRGAAGCVLLGDPAYYRRFGFVVHPGLTLPDVPPEYFQAVLFSGQWAEGEVAYHEAFGATE